MKRCTLKPILGKKLKILFIGQNPAVKSCENGVYFTSRRMFWELLHESGLTDEILVSEQWENGKWKMKMKMGSVPINSVAELC